MTALACLAVAADALFNLRIVLRLKIEAEVQFAECKVRAEIRCGELLQAMAASGERDAGKGGDRKSQSHDATVKLANFGLTKDQSSRFQEVARAPKERVEEVMRNGRETATPITSAQVRKLSEQAKADQPTNGRLKYGGNTDYTRARLSLIPVSPG